jgi:hypothetical protein
MVLKKSGQRVDSSQQFDVVMATKVMDATQYIFHGVTSDSHFLWEKKERKKIKKCKAGFPIAIKRYLQLGGVQFAAAIYYF